MLWFTEKDPRDRLFQKRKTSVNLQADPFDKKKKKIELRQKIEEKNNI